VPPGEEQAALPRGRSHNAAVGASAIGRPRRGYRSTREPTHRGRRGGWTRLPVEDGGARPSHQQELRPPRTALEPPHRAGAREGPGPDCWWDLEGGGVGLGHRREIGPTGARRRAVVGGKGAAATAGGRGDRVHARSDRRSWMCRCRPDGRDRRHPPHLERESEGDDPIEDQEENKREAHTILWRRREPMGELHLTV
jgi:hypothetical protein